MVKSSWLCWGFLSPKTLIRIYALYRPRLQPALGTDRSLRSVNVEHAVYKAILSISSACASAVCRSVIEKVRTQVTAECGRPPATVVNKLIAHTRWPELHARAADGIDVAARMKECFSFFLPSLPTTLFSPSTELCADRKKFGLPTARNRTAIGLVRMKCHRLWHGHLCHHKYKHFANDDAVMARHNCFVKCSDYLTGSRSSSF